ncbi:hypothetical protein [Cupriavidus lacunae]|uniref:hypothetical protein n=1 Tax=Cupriavidus lacunae TaxID=2666307 RepID=UPI001FC93DD0|nr:hypothetical protein [Cupriavidus lacunae]
MEVIMQAALELTRSIDKDLEDLDETDQAIDRLGKRLEAQEQRIAQLKRDGIDSTSAEQIRGSIHGSLKELIMHRALIIHALSAGTEEMPSTSRVQDVPRLLRSCPQRHPTAQHLV